MKKSGIFCLTFVWHVRPDPEILSDIVFRCIRCQILVYIHHGCNYTKGLVLRRLQVGSVSLGTDTTGFWPNLTCQTSVRHNFFSEPWGQISLYNFLTINRMDNFRMFPEYSDQYSKMLVSLKPHSEKCQTWMSDTSWHECDLKGWSAIETDMRVRQSSRST